MSLSPEERKIRMEALRKKFLLELPSLVRDALAFFEESWGGAEDDERAALARRRLHTLAGTLATFGFLRLTEDIRSLEYCISPDTLRTEPVGEREMLKGMRICTSIRTQVEDILREPGSPSSPL